MHYKPHLLEETPMTAQLLSIILFRSTDIFFLSSGSTYTYRCSSSRLYRLNVTTDFIITTIAANSKTFARSKFSIQILFSRQALMIRNLLLHYTKSQKLGRCVWDFIQMSFRGCFLFFFKFPRPFLRDLHQKGAKYFLVVVVVFL